jgi:hypothetical protein
MKPRFLLDEHIDHSIQRQLRRLDPHVDVIAIGESGSPAAGTSDSDILLWMEESGYILITENRSTIPDHLKNIMRPATICPACSGFGHRHRLAELSKNCI